ncbi:MAG: pacearchaeosortase [Nanoarchaeota archaeon]
MKNKNKFLGIFLRYAILVLAAIPNLWIFYFIFTPLTVYPVFFLIKIFFDAFLMDNIIVVNNEVPIEIIKACIAGSAYYLLLILNLSTPNMKFKKRINLILISFALLLTINVFRILALSVIFLEGFSWFILTHKFFWYFMSTIFVAGIWFAEVKYFKIKDYPLYSDLKFLYNKSLIKLSRKNLKLS